MKFYILTCTITSTNSSQIRMFPDSKYIDRNIHIMDFFELGQKPGRVFHYSQQ